MYTGLIHLHSLLRWVALLAIAVAIVRAFNGARKNQAFTAADNRWSLITLIVFHLQLVIGLALYFSQGWQIQFGKMDDKVIRFFAVEHLFAMLIVVALVTIGRARAKRAAEDVVKHRRQFVFFTLAFLLLIANIPWPFREVGAGKSWFPGF